MYEELDRLIREYIRMGYSYETARDAACHEYKTLKSFKREKEAAAAGTADTDNMQQLSKAGKPKRKSRIIKVETRGGRRKGNFASNGHNQK